MARSPPAEPTGSGATGSGGVLERQLGDVAGVLKARRDDLDLEYLRAAAASLALGEELERSLAGVGLA